VIKGDRCVEEDERWKTLLQDEYKTVLTQM